MKDSRKLNLGCGTDVRADYVNLDAAALPGADVVHDLETFPYPFEDDAFDEIVAVSVLEHLSNTVKVMEELWRIARNDASVNVLIPYWNSVESITDPTHAKLFNEHTFDFFDPDKPRCRARPYYTKARFRIETERFWIRPFPSRDYLKIESPFAKKCLSALSLYLGNVIRMLEYRLRAIK